MKNKNRNWEVTQDVWRQAVWKTRKIWHKRPMVRKITINRMVSIGFRWIWSEIFAEYNICTHLNGMQCTLHMFEHGFVWPKTDILESLILMLSLCLQTHHTHIHVDVYCIPLHWSFSSVSIRSVRAAELRLTTHIAWSVYLLSFTMVKSYTPLLYVSYRMYCKRNR